MNSVSLSRAWGRRLDRNSRNCCCRVEGKLPSELTALSSRKCTRGRVIFRSKCNNIRPGWKSVWRRNYPRVGQCAIGGERSDRIGRNAVSCIVEAFRDRVSRNVQSAMNVAIEPLAWEAAHPDLDAIPARIGQMFLVHWDLLAWLLPIRIVGGLFRRLRGPELKPKWTKTFVG